MQVQGCGLSWLLLGGSTEGVQELGAGTGCSGVIREFSISQAEKKSQPLAH